MSKQLLVITGFKRVGKDTAGDYLVKKHGYIKAQPLACFKPAIQRWFGFNDEQMNGSLKEVVDPRWGVSPRELMQVFGTDLMREDLNFHLPAMEKKIGKALWVNVFKNWYENQPDGKYVLCDYRFLIEHDVLAELPNVTFIRVYNGKKSKDMHVSEKGIAHLPVDHTIANTGTFEEYYRNLDALEAHLNG